MSLKSFIHELLQEPVAVLETEDDIKAYGQRVNMYVERIVQSLGIPTENLTDDLYNIRVMVGALFGPDLTGYLPPDVQVRPTLNRKTVYGQALDVPFAGPHTMFKEEMKEDIESHKEKLIIFTHDTKPPDEFNTILHWILRLQRLYTVRIRALVMEIVPDIQIHYLPEAVWNHGPTTASQVAGFNRDRLHEKASSLAHTNQLNLPFVGFLVIYELMFHERPISTPDGKYTVARTLFQAVENLHEALIEAEMAMCFIRCACRSKYNLPDQSYIAHHVHLYSRHINDALFAIDIKRVMDRERQNDQNLAGANIDEARHAQISELCKNLRVIAQDNYLKRDRTLRFKAFAMLVRHRHASVTLNDPKVKDHSYIVEKREQNLKTAFSKAIGYVWLNRSGALPGFLESWINELDYADNLLLRDRTDGVPDECTLFLTLARVSPTTLRHIRESIRDDLRRFVHEDRAVYLTWLNGYHVRKAGGQTIKLRVQRKPEPRPPERTRKKKTAAAGGGRGQAEVPSSPRSRKVVYPRAQDELTGFEGLRDMMEFLNSDACLKVGIPTDWHGSLSFQSSECIRALTRMRTALDKEVLSLTPFEIYDQTNMVTIESLKEFVTDAGQATPEDKDQRRGFLAALIQDIYEITRTMKCHTLSVMNIDERHFKILHWYAVMLGDDRGPIGDMYPYLTTIRNFTFLVVEEGGNTYNDADHAMTEMCKHLFKVMKEWEKQQLFPAIHFESESGDLGEYLEHLPPSIYQNAYRELKGAFIRRVDYYKHHCTKVNDHYNVYIVHREILDLANLLYQTLLQTETPEVERSV